ncbi:hypothetical protein [Clostridium sp.]|uniref:hypothetical protein n=1 Tax=Clostridium sp. TaxID=1506 RepID=UPI00283D23B2|nr:hypothetical protein [Clostridium sp.]MDR3597374.1 hypothetical protein [Clostridium sp.]
MIVELGLAIGCVNIIQDNLNASIELEKNEFETYIRIIQVYIKIMLFIYHNMV